MAHPSGWAGARTDEREQRRLRGVAPAGRHRGGGEERVEREEGEEERLLRGLDRRRWADGGKSRREAGKQERRVRPRRRAAQRQRRGALAFQFTA